MSLAAKVEYESQDVVVEVPKTSTTRLTTTLYRPVSRFRVFVTRIRHVVTQLIVEYTLPDGTLVTRYAIATRFIETEYEGGRTTQLLTAYLQPITSAANVEASPMPVSSSATAVGASATAQDITARLGLHGWG
jgi:hypothetical protein